MPKHAGNNPYLLAASFGVEGFFSGFAMGVCPTSSAMWQVFLSIFMHTWAEGLAIGISFAKGDFSKVAKTLSSFLLALDAPIGGIFGMMFQELMSNKVKGIVLSVVAGLFLYAGASEILTEEFSSSKRSCIKYFFYTTGFFFMMFIDWFEIWISGGKE